LLSTFFKDALIPTINLISPIAPAVEALQYRLPVEWLQMCHGGHNVLLEGPSAATEAALGALRPYLRRTIAWEQLRHGYALHAGPASVLVLRDAASLRQDEQRRLLELLSDRRNPLQVICSTNTSLFPLVARGLFDEALYYRLNVVLVRMDGQDSLD
jgi:hypothetical protein